MKLKNMPTNARKSPEDRERETVLSKRDAKRFVELLDRAPTWNARLLRSLEEYHDATRGDPTRPFVWPCRGKFC